MFSQNESLDKLIFVGWCLDFGYWCSKYFLGMWYLEWNCPHASQSSSQKQMHVMEMESERYRDRETKADIKTKTQAERERVKEAMNGRVIVQQRGCLPCMCPTQLQSPTFHKVREPTRSDSWATLGVAPKQKQTRKAIECQGVIWKAVVPARAVDSFGKVFTVNYYYQDNAHARYPKPEP